MFVKSHQLGCQRIIHGTVGGHDTQVPWQRMTCVTNGPPMGAYSHRSSHRPTATDQIISNSVPMTFPDAVIPLVPSFPHRRSAPRCRYPRSSLPRGRAPSRRDHPAPVPPRGSARPPPQPRSRLTRRAAAPAPRRARAARRLPPRRPRSWPGRSPAPGAAGWPGAGASPPPRRR